jgi:DnaJ-class molecular chaperone
MSPWQATAGEIQTAFRGLSKQYHPDLLASFPREFQELAHRKMSEINAAREWALARVRQ